MTWYQMEASELDEHLLEDCWRLCRDLCCSAESTAAACAIFERMRGDVRTIFFAPAVGQMAEKLGARRCQKPSAQGLVLTHGETAAWHIHFGATADARCTAFESTYRLAL